MRAVLQRVTRAQVTVEGEVVGRIERPGLVALVAATTWVLDRLGLLNDPLAGVEENLVGRPWWVVTALAALALAARVRAGRDIDPAPSGTDRTSRPAAAVR